MKRPEPGRRQWLPILFAFTMMPLLLGLVAYTSSNRAVAVPPPMSPGLVYAVATLSLVAGILTALLRLRPGQPNQVFQTNLVMSLAFSEFTALIGFIAHTADPSGYAPFAIASVVVNVLFVAPRVLAQRSG